MSVWWRLTDEEAEELSGILFQHYSKATRKKSEAELAEATLKYWAKLIDRADARKRNAETGRLHSCTVVFNLDDRQYRRLCAVQDAASNGEEPEDMLSFLLNVGSARLINERLTVGERAFLNGAERGTEESG